MTIDEIIGKVYKLYEKYGVAISFLDNMGKDEVIRGMKGVLAELDKKKKKPYADEDLLIIREIYGRCC